MNKLIVKDSGSPNEGIPSSQCEVETPFNLTSKPEEQDDIKAIRLFQIQIEKVYQGFAVGSISSIYDFELNEMVRDSMNEELERDDLENLRSQEELDEYMRGIG